MKILVIMLLIFGSSFAMGQTPDVREIQELKAEIKALKERKLECQDGKSVTGAVNKWSPWSTCTDGFVVTGLARVDIHGNHDVATNHVNDFQCGDKGCRAWCIGNSCEVVARCCR